MYSSHQDDPSGATESQDAAAEAANPSQRQDPSEGMSTPPGRALGRKGKYVSAMRAIINDKGEITGTSKSIQRKLVTDEEKRHSSRTVEGRTELDLVQDEVDEAKRLLEEAHVEVKSSLDQNDRSSIPSGRGDGGNVPDQETVGGETGASRSMKTGKQKRLLGGIKKTKTMRNTWYEAIKEEEKTTK